MKTVFLVNMAILMMSSTAMANEVVKIPLPDGRYANTKGDCQARMGASYDILKKGTEFYDSDNTYICEVISFKQGKLKVHCINGVGGQDEGMIEYNLTKLSHDFVLDGKLYKYCSK